MICKICNQNNQITFHAIILNKYNVNYYHCSKCDFLQTEEPYWLEEAYNKSINISDIGIISRNLSLAQLSTLILYCFFDLKQKNIIEHNKLSLNKDVFFIATASIARSFDLSKLTQSYATNIIQTLEVAIYLGFDRKLLPLKDPNFNDNSTCKKDFFIQMETTYTVFQALKIVHNYARKHKIEIYYTNKESLLKFFEYKEFEELFNA